MMHKPKTLIADIETCPSLFLAFKPGEQVLGFGQALGGYLAYNRVICIGYKWEHEKKVHLLNWGDNPEDEKKMIAEFDALVKEADVFLGKNNNRFDNKHINTQRLFFDLPACPDWLEKSDDLETQMRRYFWLPSQSLDCISQLLGLGGKSPMVFSDWKDITQDRVMNLLQQKGLRSKDCDAVCQILYGTKTYSEVYNKGTKALEKMYKYCKKDVADTAAIWEKVKIHVKPRFNYDKFAAAHGKAGGEHCPRCGSTNLKKNGQQQLIDGLYQRLACRDCLGYSRIKILTSGKLAKFSKM